MEIFGESLNVLERAMDIRARNQQVIAANLANIDTPGYTAQRLDFQASMEKAIKGLDEAPVIEASTEPVRTLDGNNVDLETELSEMTRNKLMYSVSSQLMAAKFRQLSTLLDQTQ